MESFISDNCKIGINVTFGHFAVIEEDVQIGENCIIGHNVSIRKGSIIGANVRIDDNAVIGKEPMRSVNSIFKNEEKLPPAEIGDNCLIGTGSRIVAMSFCEPRS